MFGSIPFSIAVEPIMGREGPKKKESNITLFNALIDIKILELLYVKSSEWPLILWDEYYDDGTPATLNWELVVSNLAGVYTKGLLYNTSNFTLDTSNTTPGRMIP